MEKLFTPAQARYQHEHYNDNRTPSLVAGSIILILFATVAVILRLCARRSRNVALAADDYALVASLALAYGLFISMLYMLRFGFGKHIARVGLEHVILAGRALYVLEAIFPACTALTKASILLLYRRIFTMLDPVFRWSLYIIFVLLFAWANAGFFTTVFQCWPVYVAWTRRGGHCIALQPSLIGLATINTILNLSVLILPVPMIWNLQISLRRKIGLCAIFILGCGDVASSIARTVITATTDLGSVVSSPEKPEAPPISETSPLDITWNLADAAMLALVEPCLGIICACLPVMPSLWMPIFGRLRRMISSRRSSGVAAKKSDRGSSEDDSVELTGGSSRQGSRGDGSRTHSQALTETSKGSILSRMENGEVEDAGYGH